MFEGKQKKSNANNLGLGCSIKSKERYSFPIATNF